MLVVGGRIEGTLRREGPLAALLPLPRLRGKAGMGGAREARDWIRGDPERPRPPPAARREEQKREARARAGSGIASAPRAQRLQDALPGAAVRRRQAQSLLFVADRAPGVAADHAVDLADRVP